MNSGSISNRLPVLAEGIRRAVSDSLAAARTAIECAIRAGEQLAEAKTLLPHGSWLRWLREHCGLSERTAQRYMRLARHKDEIKSDTVSDLTIREVLELLNGRSHLQRALALEAEGNALRLELDELAAMIDSADLAGLRYIIERAEEIDGEAFEIRARSMLELGRLLKKGNTAIGFPTTEVRA